MNLEPIINNRQWIRHAEPFPYVYATEVFTPTFYETMNREYCAIRAKGTHQAYSNDTTVLSKTMKGYDAYGLAFDHKTTGALSVFTSTEWCDLMAQMFAVNRTPHINAGIHHHQIGSADGWIHNDLNPVWFPVAGTGKVQHPAHAICAYKDGAGSLRPEEKVEVVRAVVMIYYLCNDGWQDGFGGETGFYKTRKANVKQPVVKIPPLNNSLIMYECTPYSYHSFIANNTQERNSVIMWVHRSMNDALMRWPENRLEEWTK